MSAPDQGGGLPVRRWRILAVAVVLVSAVVVGGAESAGATTTTTSGSPGATPTSPFAGLVATSPRRKVYLACRGTGSPTVVLIAGGINSAAIWSMPYDFEELAGLSSDSVHVLIPKSGHNIQLEDPQPVIAAVREVITAVRTHRRLPSCPETFPALGGVCFPAL